MCFGDIVYLLLSGLFQKKALDLSSGKDSLDRDSCVNNQCLSLGMDMNLISDPREDLT